MLILNILGLTTQLVTGFFYENTSKDSNIKFNNRQPTIINDKIEFMKFPLLFSIIISQTLKIIYVHFFIANGTIDIQEMIQAEKAKQGISYIASSIINWTS